MINRNAIVCDRSCGQSNPSQVAVRRALCRAAHAAARAAAEVITAAVRAARARRTMCDAKVGAHHPLLRVAPHHAR
jgi:hypothetical protein